MNWDDIRMFLALARKGSARSAAEQLNVSHTTISRRAEQLESDLGTRLFDRDVSGYRLTGEGEQLLLSAEKAEDVLLAAQRRLHGRDSQLSGEIRVTTSDILGSYVLAEDFVEFSARYPEIDLNVLISYDVFDLARREADVAIRFIGKERSPPDALVGRCLLRAYSCYYASEKYLQSHDPHDPQTDARWIGWDDRQRFPEWVLQSPFPHVPVYGSFNNGMLQAEMTRAGMGMATLPVFVGDQLDGVRRIPGCQPYENYDVWLLSHPDLRDAARLRTFRAFMVDVFREKRELLQGF